MYCNHSAAVFEDFSIIFCFWRAWLIDKYSILASIFGRFTPCISLSKRRAASLCNVLLMEFLSITVVFMNSSVWLSWAGNGTWYVFDRIKAFSAAWVMEWPHTDRTTALPSKHMHHSIGGVNYLQQCLQTRSSHEMANATKKTHFSVKTTKVKKYFSSHYQLAQQQQPLMLSTRVVCQRWWLV